MLPLEAPARVNQAILDFVASLDAGGPRPAARIEGAIRRSILRRLLDRATALFRGD